MKKCSKIVLLLAVMSLAGFVRQSCASPACPLTLEWQASPDAGVAGYTLYYGRVGSPMTNQVDVGMQTAASLNNLTATMQYSFYVVAYDANHIEGLASDPLVCTASSISALKLCQPVVGGGMKISFRVAPSTACRVEYTDTLNPASWQLLTTAVSDSNGAVTISDLSVQPMRFYRGVAQ